MGQDFSQPFDISCVSARKQESERIIALETQVRDLQRELDQIRASDGSSITGSGKKILNNNIATTNNNQQSSGDNSGTDPYHALRKTNSSNGYFNTPKLSNNNNTIDLTSPSISNSTSKLRSKSKNSMTNVLDKTFLNGAIPIDDYALALCRQDSLLIDDEAESDAGDTVTAGLIPTPPTSNNINAKSRLVVVNKLSQQQQQQQLKQYLDDNDDDELKLDSNT
jgi:hypothetical protein